MLWTVKNNFMKQKLTILLVLFLNTTLVIAQADRWQQRIDYKIIATLDVTTNIVKGAEEIVYTNTSPDTLRKV